MGSEEKPTSRRTVLKGLLASGAIGYAGINAVSADTGSDMADFGDGIDGWRTEGPNKISRISEEEIPGADFSGGYALRTEVNRYPAVLGTTKDIVDRDLSDAEYIIADALVIDKDTSGEVEFKLELHHTDTPAGGSSNRGRGQSSPGNPLVNEVGVSNIPQLTFTQVYWDVRDVSDSVLEDVKRLRIYWEPEGEGTSGGGQGRGNGPGSNPGSFDDLLGDFILDRLRYVTDSSEVDGQLSVQAMNSHRRRHGRIVDREVDVGEDDYEEGRIILRDGTEIEYSFETVGDKKYIKMLDGEEFRLGEGW